MISPQEKTSQVDAGADCPPVGQDFSTAYLELLKRCLCDLIHFEYELKPKSDGKLWRRSLTRLINALSSRRSQLLLIDRAERSLQERIDGRDWPITGHTMIGLKRLNNIQFCLEQIFRDKVAGDLIEAGVWRGGASALMKAMLTVHGEEHRTLWLADSFAGLPKPNEQKYPADKGIHLYQFQELAVSLDQVQSNFARYGLLDDNVRFLKGWFSETLPTAPVEKLALIRADGDLYESTWDILSHLYPKLAVGGYIIIDDFQIPACRQAVADYREQNGISEPIEAIDWAGVYWRRAT